MNKKAIYKFCPLCRGDFETKTLVRTEPQRLVCKECGFIFYLDPKLVACTIAQTINGIVLQQRNKSPKRGQWVLPGGFVDRGETLEEAARREFFEETGLETAIKCLLGNYSYPGEANIIIVYQSDIIGGTIRPCHESMSIGEFAPEKIPWDQLAFETTRKALERYMEKNYPSDLCLQNGR
ncbi:MAG: NUDIX domain-containing protein [Proteobacteria bacterium]|nr:NUDIX hydrolase [Desulfobacula sp.]MBU4130127.1 NUDIX domain-containing protein [Pseudomonadota bacterium]